MNLPYTLRLLCLCGATFFMVHMALAMAARLGAGTAVRVAEHMKPRSAARLLFALRIAPLALSLFVVLAFCIPSYLWLEPELNGERVGWACMLIASMGIAIWIPALVRVIGAMRGTARYVHRCERHGRKITMPGEASPALLLADKAPVLAVAGVFRPQLLISRRVMRGLSAEQREAALRHERAHCAAGDNFKRFLILLAPDALPFVRTFRNVEQAWSKFTEWAADDQATEGDPQRPRHPRYLKTMRARGTGLRRIGRDGRCRSRASSRARLPREAKGVDDNRSAGKQHGAGGEDGIEKAGDG